MRNVALALSACLVLAPGASLAQGGGRDRQATPASVTFDFESGVKTTIYVDGNVQEEGFDTRRMRGVASKPSQANDVTSTPSPVR